MWEGELGVVTGSDPIRKKVPVEDYLKTQRRFAHLFKPERDEERLAALQRMADHNIDRFDLLREDKEPAI